MPSNLRRTLYACLLLSSLFTVFNSCIKSHNPPGNQAAKGSLQAEGGACLPGTVHGNWYAGMASGSDSNYVDVSVNVTKTGSYTIATDSAGGVKFSGSGNFTVTGLQMVRLTAAGKFNVVGNVNFNTTFDGSACGFSVNVKAPPIADNSWHATIGGRVYWGSANAVVIFFQGDEAFDFHGTVANSSDTTLYMRVRMQLIPNGESVTFGTYRSSFPGARFFLQAKGVTYLHAQGAGPGIMNIILSDVVRFPNGSAQYEGKFNGTVKDDAGNITEVTDGVFRAGSE